MKLVLQDGCFDRTLLVDGKDAESLDSRVLRDIFISLLEPFTEATKRSLIHSINDLIEISEDTTYENLGDCEQCGSYSERWTKEI